jgi:hypothetical protein
VDVLSSLGSISVMNQARSSSKRSHAGCAMQWWVAGPWLCQFAGSQVPATCRLPEVQRLPAPGQALESAFNCCATQAITDVKLVTLWCTFAGRSSTRVLLLRCVASGPQACQGNSSWKGCGFGCVQNGMWAIPLVHDSWSLVQSCCTQTFTMKAGQTELWVRKTEAIRHRWKRACLKKESRTIGLSCHSFRV